MIKACIFDLDGVIVDTAKYHFLAWQNMAHTLGIAFTEKQNEKLKGVGRMESLKFIINLKEGLHFSDHELIKLAAAKNNHYLKLIQELDQNEILPGVENFLTELRDNDVKIGLGSSSKNAAMILKKLGIDHYFEAMIDGTKTTKTKPDPQVFQLGAKELSVAPEHTVVFEDAAKGIESALGGGFKVIGIGDEEELSKADQVIPGFGDFNYSELQKIYN
jgi:beta-phosphoglucomutase